MEEMMIDFIENPILNLTSHFKEQLIVKPSIPRREYSYANGYYSSSYSKRDGTMFFYQWSSMQGGTKTFYLISDLKKFLDESKIEYTETQIEMIKKGEDPNYWYLSCIPNSPKLLVLKSYQELKASLQRFHDADGTDMNHYIPSNHKSYLPQQYQGCVKGSHYRSHDWY